MFKYDFFNDDDDDWDEEKTPKTKDDDLKECESWIKNQKV